MQLPEFSQYQSEQGLFTFSLISRQGPFSMADNHCHDYYELYFLIDGQRNYFINDQTYQVSSGDLVLINRSELHKTLDAGSQEHRRFLVNMMPAALTVWPDLDKLMSAIFISGRPVVRLQGQAADQIRLLAEQLIRQMSQPELGLEIMLQGLLMQLLVCLARYRQSTSPSEVGLTSVTHRKTGEIVRYINQHYQQPLSLGILAQKYFVSPCHLSRLFRAGTGFSLVEYINAVRIREAQKMLRQTDWPVIRIAEQSGYGSVAHFGRMFRTITGIPPLTYRRNNR